MVTRLSGHHPVPRPWAVLLAVVLGALAGFGVGAVAYLAVNPLLEDASGWVRELQGLAWNLVPLLTVGGAALGGVLASRRSS